MIVAIHIVKSVTWRGAYEEFENTYHYDVSPGQTQGTWASLAGLIADIEKGIHGDAVTFRRFLVNGPTNLTPADNIMVAAGDLTGAGTVASGSTMPKEMAVVCQLYMGRSGAPFNRKTFLRKYFHVARLSPAGSGDDALGNSALSAGQISFYKAAMNNLKTINGWTSAADLVKPNGTKIPLATDAQVLPYAHIRQFRR
jgi:hypothetical protein